MNKYVVKPLKNYSQKYLARWLAEAYGEAALSKCNTQVGAVVLCEDMQTFAGNNVELPDKSIHAEEAAIASMLIGGGNPEGAILFAPWFACADCAYAIVDSGIKRVVGHKEIMGASREINPKWNESIEMGSSILVDGGVESFMYSGLVEAYAIRLGGVTFRPAMEPHVGGQWVLSKRSRG